MKRSRFASFTVMVPFSFLVGLFNAPHRCDIAQHHA